MINSNLQKLAESFAKEQYKKYKTDIFKRAILHKDAIAYGFTEAEFDKLFIAGKICRVGHGRYSISKYLKQEPKKSPQMSYDVWVDWLIKNQPIRRQKLKEKNKL